MEIRVNVAGCDEIYVGVEQESEVVVQAFDYPPEITALKTRVDILEDDYLVKVIVPEAVDSVEVTHDRFGQPLNIRDLKRVTIFFRCNFGSAQELSNRLNLRFNGVGSAIYRWYSSILNYLPTSDANDLWSSGSVEITLIDREAQGVTFVKTNRGRTSFSFDTSGLNSESINSILFYPNNSALKIPAGTIIVIK